MKRTRSEAGGCYLIAGRYLGWVSLVRLLWSALGHGLGGAPTLIALLPI